MRTASILLAGALAACGGSTDPETPPIISPAADAVVDIRAPAEVTLAIGQSIRLQDPDLRILFEAVPEDSRCPTDVVCVWAGDARMAFQASGGADRRFSLHLPTEQVGPASMDIGGYRIEVTQLSPEPGTFKTNAPERYRVTLVIRQL